MSSQGAAEFLSTIAQNETLAAEVEQALSSASDRFAALAGIASAHGYEVTAEELRLAAEAGAVGAEMDESDLEKAAGGAGFSASQNSSPSLLPRLRDGGAVGMLSGGSVATYGGGADLQNQFSARRFDR